MMSYPTDLLYFEQRGMITVQREPWKFWQLSSMIFLESYMRVHLEQPDLSLEV